MASLGVHAIVEGMKSGISWTSCHYRRYDLWHLLEFMPYELCSAGMSTILWHLHSTFTTNFGNSRDSYRGEGDGGLPPPPPPPPLVEDLAHVCVHLI